MRFHAIAAASLTALIVTAQVLAAQPKASNGTRAQPGSGGGTEAVPSNQAAANAAAYVASAAGLATGAVADRGTAQASGNDRDRASANVRVGHGTIVVNGGHATVNTQVEGTTARSTAKVRTASVSLANGLVVAKKTRTQAEADGGRHTMRGRITELVVAGRRVGDAKQRHRYPVGDYGILKVLAPVKHGIAALHLHLDRPYGDIPAGTDVVVGVARATARDRQPAQTGPDNQAPPGSQGNQTQPGTTTGPAAGRLAGPAKRKRAPKVRAPLTGQGFGFPVYGRTSWSDTFGAARSDTGVHQGIDIFATFGTPVLAVHSGRLNRVGTLPISGNRLWLKTAQGDSFFYAHLSAFAAAARNGVKVKAGRVLGFVGNTGDAAPTPPHLHFEVHPGDGDAVDPTSLLLAWQDHNDVPASTWLALYGSNPGARPGTLVEVKDYIVSE